MGTQQHVARPYALNGKPTEIYQYAAASAIGLSTALFDLEKFVLSQKISNKLGGTGNYIIINLVTFPMQRRHIARPSTILSRGRHPQSQRQ